LTFFSVVFRKSANRKYVLLICILSFIIIGTIFRVIRANGIDLVEQKMALWNDSFRTVITMRLDAIIYGVLMAYLKIYLPDFFKQYRYLFVLIGIIILVIAFKLVFLSPNFLNAAVFAHTYYFSMVGIGMALMLPYFYYLKIQKIFLIHFFTIISVLSYSIYLINYSLIQHPLIYFIPSDSILYCIIKSIIAVITTIIISSILYKIVETPFMNLRKKILHE
jgi:peptidoglycan/LPS O-acetylase OafA/YrhL